MKIGWIGTGVMGASMAGHVQAAGHQVYVYNRSRGKAAGLIEKGAAWCESPAEVASVSDAVFSIVGFPADVEEVYFGPGGVFSSSNGCRTVVDMTTTRPSLAIRIAEAARERGIEALDAPVSGGDIGARDGTLVIMVGGVRETMERLMPVFECMGSRITFMGGPGAGQHTKMCNQILVSGTMISVCESLLYAARVGLDQQAVIDVVGKGAAGSWSINNLGPRIVKGDFSSGFFIEHFIKDMGIALDEAEAMGLSLPGLALVKQLYVAVKAQGHGRSATQALYLALKAMSGKIN
ncbi:MAG TPA: NAD(P)-dependent oxidoreductase [Desulfobacteraceae bacterium]|nr:NAD(P)-dependent oxidoreductase [Desulfobacteraceae bacterium]